MKLINKDHFLAEKEFFIGEMGKGKIFIYPTDTIYGIGCDAHNDVAVQSIRKIKNRDEKPFSVIAPNKEWIRKNCFIYENASKWMERLPGPYTLILELKNLDAVSVKVNEGKDSLGIRIPKHWFSDIVTEFGKPFVTTSVNRTGESHLNNISGLSEEIKQEVDYIIDDGLLENSPSTIVKLIGGKEEIVKR